jgi:hypothetical protein
MMMTMMMMTILMMMMMMMMTMMMIYYNIMWYKFAIKYLLTCFVSGESHHPSWNDIIQHDDDIKWYDMIWDDDDDVIWYDMRWWWCDMMMWYNGDDDNDDDNDDVDVIKYLLTCFVSGESHHPSWNDIIQHDDDIKWYDMIWDDDDDVIWYDMRWWWCDMMMWYNGDDDNDDDNDDVDVIKYLLTCFVSGESHHPSWGSGSGEGIGGRVPFSLVEWPEWVSEW